MSGRADTRGVWSRGFRSRALYRRHAGTLLPGVNLNSWATPGERGFLLDAGCSALLLDHGLLNFDLFWAAQLACAVARVASFVCHQPQKMREKLNRASEALLGPARMPVEVGILSVVAAAGVVLHGLCLPIRLRLDVLVQLVVFRKIPEDGG